MSLNDWSGPHGDLHSPRVRLLDPYTLVANEVLRTVSGKTHIPCVIGRRGLEMFECGKNSAMRRVRGPVERIRGPTLVTCLKCTLIALQRLGRDGKLKWSACARKAKRGIRQQRKETP